MKFDIEDSVPMPEPDKPGTWVSWPQAAPESDGWVTSPHGNSAKPEPSLLKPAVVAKAPPSRYPAVTTHDAKGVPTVDCFLVGGPLNGQHGPLVGTDKTVELEVYAADGSVSSVELYELGDKGDLGCRIWKGTKAEPKLNNAS